MDLIDSKIKKYMRKAYFNRRILPETGADAMRQIRSIDKEFSPIEFPKQFEGTTGKRIFDLPEIPYRAAEATNPILLFRGEFPTDEKGVYITDIAILAASENRLTEGVDYILSGSKERPTAVELVNASVGAWLDKDGNYKDINFCFWGLGSVLTAKDFENFHAENFTADKAEVTQLAAEEFTADKANFAGMILVEKDRCEVRDTTEIGVIKMWGGVDLPKSLDGETSNYLWCRGQDISKADYPALFAAWGITASMIKLPNFIGRVPIGAGTVGKDENEESPTFMLRNKYGEWKHKITIDEMPKHSHGMPLGRKDGDASYKTASFLTPETNWKERDTTSAGGDKAMSLIPASIAVNFIVRYR